MRAARGRSRCDAEGLKHTFAEKRRPRRKRKNAKRKLTTRRSALGVPEPSLGIWHPIPGGAGPKETSHGGEVGPQRPSSPRDEPAKYEHSSSSDGNNPFENDVSFERRARRHAAYRGTVLNAAFIVSRISQFTDQAVDELHDMVLCQPIRMWSGGCGSFATTVICERCHTAAMKFSWIWPPPVRSRRCRGDRGNQLLVRNNNESSPRSGDTSLR